MSRPLRDLPADEPTFRTALADALAGTGPAVRPLAAHDETPAGGAPVGQGPDEGRRAPGGPCVPDGVAVVLRTSGSTGAPRDVMLSAAALRASAEATARRIGGPGDWLLVLPPDHVAGLQVLARAVLSGTTSLVAPPGAFRPAAFVAATEALASSDRARAGRRYTSIVPTQLVRLLDDEAGRAALRGYDAVLLGGAGIPPTLLAAARSAGVRVVTTYGMTETCGGCVYDDVPLDGVRVRIGDDGRVLLAGPVLADGYLGRPDLDAELFVRDEPSGSPLDAELFVRDEPPGSPLDAAPAGGTRWLRTSDLGRLRPDGSLEVLGRADDVVVTGGVNVAPAPVEDLLVTLPGVREACVVGVPDEEWGQAVVAVVVVGPAGPPPLAEVRALVTERLGAPSAPRRLVVVPALPTRGPGKPDRRAAATLAAADVAAPAPGRH